MAGILRVKNWGQFQHYKSRNPPWIKLHRNILDNYEFSCLPVASKALAPLLWVLASESIDGSITLDITKLAFRLRVASTVLADGLPPLIQHGFFSVDGFEDGDASSVLAQCYQLAPKNAPETEAETEAEILARRVVTTERCTREAIDPITGEVIYLAGRATA